MACAAVSWAVADITSKREFASPSAHENRSSLVGAISRLISSGQSEQVLCMGGDRPWVEAFLVTSSKFQPYGLRLGLGAMQAVLRR